MNIARGDGVGLEISTDVIRAVRLRHDLADRVSHATELPIALDDERRALDTMVLLWTELGEPIEPTRLAVFPRGSTLQRLDVTGKSGTELSALRDSLLRRRGFDSSVIVEDGPRRWLVVIGWDVATPRRVEQLAERAGFRDVSVEPSPLAIGRVLPVSTTVCRRATSRHEGFVTVLDRGVPVAAAAADVTARQHPDAHLGEPDLPAPWFEDLVESDALEDLLARASATLDIGGDTRGSDALEASVGGTGYPTFPVHDVRAVQRQVVAVGAAAASSGLSSIARPVDVIGGTDPTDRFDRPWVWERMSELPEVAPGTGPNAVRRAGARFIPRRRRRDAR